ncbi:pyrimidine reductase [Mesorhizobium sp. L-8-10]|uniref:dihydrofolate reductase family protein n=1 Tax=Mesorhizobium sp. L-8-10 TaxID=2744523 RepID=UPI0019280141|nr:dihydrofolate reductase family protein [Mesorhizobium sp. L-8-10]BCH31403.1 pyrimidine reductase [Mesorhizobium sp. L-8-10]
MPRKIVVTQYMSLDGVIQDPVGMEASGLGDWTGPFERGPEGDRFKHDELFGSEALLLGRTTYDSFAAVWPAVKDETGFADRINTMPKFVVSNSLHKAEWANTTVLSGDVVAKVKELKEMPGGDVLIYGSAALVHALARQGLVDAYSLMIYPTVLGRGKRLFPDGVQSMLALEDCRRLGSGIVLLRYRQGEVP